MAGCNDDMGGGGGGGGGGEDEGETRTTMMTINGGGRSCANLTPSWIARQGGRSVGDDDNCNNADATVFVGGAETMTMTYDIDDEVEEKEGKKTEGRCDAQFRRHQTLMPGKPHRCCCCCRRLDREVHCCLTTTEDITKRDGGGRGEKRRRQRRGRGESWWWTAMQQPTNYSSSKGGRQLVTTLHEGNGRRLVVKAAWRQRCHFLCHRLSLSSCIVFWTTDFNSIALVSCDCAIELKYVVRTYIFVFRKVIVTRVPTPTHA